MISIEQIRNNVENVRKQLSLKGDISSIDDIVSLDESYRSHISKSNELDVSMAITGIRHFYH